MNYQKGFSLIEIFVVIAILGIILAFGMTINLSAFTTGTLQGEESKIVSIFGRARSHAMANMFQSPFTVCYVSTNYVISYDGTCNGSGTDETIPANTNLTITLTPYNITFNQLTGNTGGATVDISDGTKVLHIIINNEGTINW